jgi:eukaryotic-like serine/threonine-protein kinase
MTAAQWHRVKEITADALERKPAVRSEFVAQSCDADPDVRREVLRLLVEAENSEESFLSTPPLSLRDLLARVAPPMPRFSRGQTVAGRFQIECFLGQGGMGEVYSALDLELHESVALKTIRSGVASSADAIERFKSEVKQSRGITHPNVCRVYDLFSHEESSGESIWFLTMELLRGETLADYLSNRGFLTADQAIPLIRDMVAALTAAHELGIVHRDFKPNNVMLVKAGSEQERLVVADFGLALNISSGQAIPGAGAGDGTPAYMAPEQVSGGSVGFGADQFSLGLVICEMLTGSRPILDRTSAEESRRQLNAWLQQQPRRRLNGGARRAIRRCLEFRPEDRFHHVRDIVPVMDGVRRRARWRRTAAAAAVVCGLALALIVAAPDTGPRVTDAVPLTPESGLSASPSISRDGKWVVYKSDRAEPGNLDIWIQPASGGLAKRLTTHPAVDTDPSVAPDGKLVAFRSERNGGGIYLIGSDGSGERLLVGGGQSPAFSPDGRWIAFWLGDRDDAAPSGQLYLISPEGGPPRRLAADFADARYPTWNSSGQLLLFEGCRTNAAALSSCTDWWVARADGSNARDTRALALLKSQKIDIQTPPQKAWRGDEVYFSGARGTIVALWALRLARGDMHPVEGPRRITSGDAKEREPAVAEDGSIVFGRATGALHIWSLPLKRGVAAATRVTNDPALDGCPSVSRDGRWLFFTRKTGDVRQLLVRDLSGERDSVVFASAEDKFWPISTPEGDRVVFEVRQKTDSSIWMADRGGKPHRLCSGCSHPTSWFGGQAVFYTTSTGAIALLDVVTGASRVVLSPESGAVLGGADWNAANQCLLFTAGRQGAAKQVFAVRFSSTAQASQGPWVQLTQELAEIDQPHWSADGKVFFFLSNRDGYNCVWGRLFSALSGGASGLTFPVMHFHDARSTPDRASPIARGLTVASDSIFLNVGEVTDTLWLGRLTDPPLISLIRKLSFWP